MKRLKIITALVILICASPVSAVKKAELRGVGQFEIPAWFKNSFLDLRIDVREASEQGKRLFLYFGQDGCPYCAELFNNNFSQKHIIDYTRKHFDAIEINMWGDREVSDFSGRRLSEKQFAADLKVWFTPTILLFNERKEVVLRINGYYPPHQFLTALKYVAEKHEKELPFREYSAKFSPPPATGKLHKQPFFMQPPYDLAKRKQQKPLAVFFEQKDCADCDYLHNNILKQPATLEQLKRFDVVQLDRWSHTAVITPGGKKTTAQEWAHALNISYSPSAVLFDQGKEIVRIEAFLKAFHVQSLFDYVASGAYQHEPDLQRYIGKRADHIREQGIIVDIWQ